MRNKQRVKSFFYVLRITRYVLDMYVFQTLPI